MNRSFHSLVGLATIAASLAFSAGCGSEDQPEPSGMAGSGGTPLGTGGMETVSGSGGNGSGGDGSGGDGSGGDSPEDKVDCWGNCPDDPTASNPCVSFEGKAAYCYKIGDKKNWTLGTCEGGNKDLDDRECPVEGVRGCELDPQQTTGYCRRE